jgi:hypothetical protein
MSNLIRIPMIELGVGMSNWNSKPLSSLLEEGRGISYGIVQPGPHQKDGVPILRIRMGSNQANHLRCF